MIFARPQLLWYLLAVPLLLILLRAVFVSVLPGLTALSQNMGRGSLASVQAQLRSRNRRQGLCFAAGLGCCILALAEPSLGSKLIRVQRSGHDIVLALDLSLSMDAQDVFPSRLGKALSLANELVAALPEARFAVSLAKGRGLIALPLSGDRESLRMLLSTVSTASVSGRGTDLEHLLIASMDAFAPQAGSARSVVLFSDGEALSGLIAQTAARYRQEGIALYTVLVGSEAGSTIPLYDGQELLDEHGLPQESRARPETLHAAAERANGLFIDGNNSGAVAALRREILKDQEGAVFEGFRSEPRHISYLFIVIGLCFFFLADYFGTRVWRRV
jgi:Ca-activated chloride channel homolog